MRAQDKNFGLTVSFFPLISWVWLPGWALLPGGFLGRESHHLLTLPWGHPAAKCQLNRGASEACSQKAAGWPIAMNFSGSLATWHPAALPLPQVNCWEPPTWKLLILPTSSCCPHFPMPLQFLPSYTLEVKWSHSYTWLYLWTHLSSNITASFPSYTPPWVKAELPHPPWTWLLGNTQPCEFVTSVWRKFQFHLQL